MVYLIQNGQVSEFEKSHQARKAGKAGGTKFLIAYTREAADRLAAGQKPVTEQADITSGLGIGGTGSDDYNISTEGDTMTQEYDRESHKPGDHVYPAGTTQGTRGDDDDRCWCGRPGDWNPGAGQVLCSHHWDEY